MRRYFSLDLLRGLAVFGMIVFHFFYAFDFYGIIDLDLRDGLWMLFVRIVQFVFLGLVGFSLALSQRVRPGGFLEKQLPRLAKIGLAALIVSGATYFVLDEIYVRFGVLHFIFLSSMIVFPFVARRSFLFGLVGVGVVGWVLTREVHFTFPVIAYVFGFKSAVIPALDYFPIFPWIIVVAIGALVEKFSFSIMSAVENKVVGIEQGVIGKTLLFLGRNSLLAYLLHVPLIMLILLLYSLGKDVLM